MDWLSLQRRYAVPAGASARTARLLALRRVLDGTQYDALPHPFSMERSGAGSTFRFLTDVRPSEVTFAERLSMNLFLCCLGIRTGLV